MTDHTALIAKLSDVQNLIFVLDDGTQMDMTFKEFCLILNALKAQEKEE